MLIILVYYTSTPTTIMGSLPLSTRLTSVFFNCSPASSSILAFFLHNNENIRSSIQHCCWMQERTFSMARSKNCDYIYTHERVLIYVPPYVTLRMTTRRIVWISEPLIFDNLTKVPVCGGRYLWLFQFLSKTTTVEDLHQEENYTSYTCKKVQN
jgi:hypothetical protein